MNKIDFSDSIMALGIKLFSSLSFLTTWIFGVNVTIIETLSNHGLSVEYFYFGALGQVIFTLMQLKSKLDNEEVIVKFTARAFISMVIGWIVAPMLSMVIVSTISKEYSLIFGLVALGLGASSEKAWNYVKNKALKQLDDDQNSK